MKTVAVVDDDPDNSLLIEAILKDKYNIIIYGDGLEALKGMNASPPDLVLMDISLPDLEGGKVLKLMKKDPLLASLPVIALTAYAMKGDEEKFIQDGFDGYISKPLVDFDILYKMIDDFTGTPTIND